MQFLTLQQKLFVWILSTYCWHCFCVLTVFLFCGLMSGWVQAGAVNWYVSVSVEHSADVLWQRWRRRDTATADSLRQGRGPLRGAPTSRRLWFLDRSGLVSACPLVSFRKLCCITKMLYRKDFLLKSGNSWNLSKATQICTVNHSCTLITWTCTVTDMAVIYETNYTVLQVDSLIIYISSCSQQQNKVSL